jgi:predicted TIM-barrel fold metal-dependent hydrolase
MQAVDFHAHAFPDHLAPRAISRIQGLSGIRSALDGTIARLLSSMDAAGIAKSVVLSIATKPSQFESILSWSRSIASERIVPFLSVHPSDPRAAEKVRITHEEGFLGMKFHPYYQSFSLDSEEMNPIYEALEKYGLLCVSHTGFDHAYPFVRTADPPKIVNVVRRFPGLRFVATHLGAWKDWDLAVELLASERVYVDIAYSLEFLPPEKAKSLIRSYPRDRLLFGTDSPWADQAAALRLLSGLGLPEETVRAMVSENAAGLLGE